MSNGAIFILVHWIASAMYMIAEWSKREDLTVGMFLFCIVSGPITAPIAVLTKLSYYFKIFNIFEIVVIKRREK